MGISQKFLLGVRFLVIGREIVLKSHMFAKIKITGIKSIIMGLVLFCTLHVPVVHAANLNGYETDVINAARGTFELEGTYYKVDPVFVQELTSYLSQEDVDLTASQKDEVMGMMFSNIERGVAEGYLVPIIEEDKTDDSQIVPDEIEENQDDITDEEDVNSVEEDTDENIDQDTVLEGSKEEYSDVLDEIGKQATVKTEVDQNKSRVTVKKDDSNSVFVVNTVIKNTGYDVRPAIIVIFVLLGLFVFSMVVTIKSNFFRQEEHRLEQKKK